MKLDFKMDMYEKSSVFYNNPVIKARNLPFYVESGGYMLSYDEYFTEREGLDNYLLIYTIGGSGSLKYRGSKYKIWPNSCVLINCNEYHYYKTEVDFWEFKWVHINGTAASEYENLINEEDFSIVNIENTEEISELFDKVFFIMKNSHIMTDIKICPLVVELLTNITLNKNNEANNPQNIKYRKDIDKVVKFISDNYEKNIQLDDIIKSVHISKYHFVRIFKKYMSVSPYQYLQNYRINTSKRLLKETDIPISEVVSAVGFSDIHNYIKAFKKTVGTTPSDYRKHWGA